jgi:hypothetical protein
MAGTSTPSSKNIVPEKSEEGGRKSGRDPQKWGAARRELKMLFYLDDLNVIVWASSNGGLFCF